MSKVYDIAVLVGSLRKGSLNKKLAENLVDLAPASVKLRFVEIGNLPFYNEDLEGDSSVASWDKFRAEILKADGVLFVTPEYNRSMPAVIKNALDVGSRPWGKSVWGGKPAAVISGSPGGAGGMAANHSVRQPLVCLNMPTLQQPEAYIGGFGDLFDDQGKVKKEDTKKFLKTFIDAFAAWVEKLA